MASEYRLKFELARAALTFKPRDAVFVRVSAPIGPDGVQAADERALGFISMREIEDYGLARFVQEC